MGREALIEALRAKADVDRAALWSDVRAQAEARRAELERAAAEARARGREALALLQRRLEEASLAELSRRRRALRTQAALRLAEHCRELALAELPRLRDGRLFDRLAGELPALEWRRIEVNPADADAARARYPGAAVTENPAISGGLNAATADDRICLENSLETRLAAAWPDLVPALLARLLPEAAEDAAAS